MIYINAHIQIPGFDYNRTALVDKSCDFNAESYILHELDPENNGDELSLIPAHNLLHIIDLNTELSYHGMSIFIQL